MNMRQTRRNLGVSLALSLLAVQALAPTGAVAAAGPFGGMIGSWTGNGTVALDGGNTEQIRCRAQHVVQNDDNNLQQALRCASSSYKFEVNTFIDNKQGVLTGYWSELIQNVNGRVSGSANGSGVDAMLSGVGFGATFRLTQKGSEITVVITPTADTDTQVEKVSISLRKR
jgi:hypothetical protein